MYGIYANIGGILMVNVTIYIYTWILWDTVYIKTYINSRSISPLFDARRRGQKPGRPCGPCGPCGLPKLAVTEVVAVVPWVGVSGHLESGKMTNIFFTQIETMNQLGVWWTEDLIPPLAVEHLGGTFCQWQMITNHRADRPFLIHHEVDIHPGSTTTWCMMSCRSQASQEPRFFPDDGI